MTQTCANCDCDWLRAHPDATNDPQGRTSVRCKNCCLGGHVSNVFPRANHNSILAAVAFGFIVFGILRQ
jgi:hypothetical protein